MARRAYSRRAVAVQDYLQVLRERVAQAAGADPVDWLNDQLQRPGPARPLRGCRPSSTRWSDWRP